MPDFRRASREFRALSWPERGVFTRAWLMLPAVAVGLRVLRFSKLQKAMLAAPGSGEWGTDPARARSIARLVDAAAHWNPAPASCLVRSMVLCRLLQRRGLAAELRIGVAQPDGGFAAHAWVEHGGAALAEGGAASERYTPFDESILAKGT